LKGRAGAGESEVKSDNWESLCGCARGAIKGSKKSYILLKRSIGVKMGEW
jgi:hypothetical protein